MRFLIRILCLLGVFWTASGSGVRYAFVSHRNPSTTPQPTPPPTPSTTKKPFDNWAVLAKLREERKGKSTPVPIETESTTPDPNFFAWRERQETRMQQLFAGNPHTDNRLEAVMERREAREKRPRLPFAILSTKDAFEWMDSLPDGKERSPAKAFVSFIAKSHQVAEEEERAEIERDEAIIQEYLDWMERYEALNARLKKREAYQRHLKERLESREVPIEDEEEIVGYYEEMRVPTQPDVFYIKTIRIPRT